MSRIFVFISTALALVAALGCGSSGAPAPTATALVMPTATPAPTATADSNDVVAVVNGEYLTSDEFNTRLAQANDSFAADGTDLSGPEAQQDLRDVLLDRMIGEMLLLQAAAAAGITAGQDTVDEQFANSASQFDSEQAFSDRLAELHLDIERFRQNIEESIVMDAYVAYYVEEVVPDAALAPTEAELQDLYDQTAAEWQGAVPSLEDLRPSLDNELRQRKVSAAVAGLFEKLRADAQIEILI